VAFATVFAVSAFIPAVALAQGNPVNDLLKGILSGGGAGGAAGPQPAAGSPPSYTPPMHGTNPHGQGDVATVDLNPQPTNPLPGGLDNSTEEVTVGQSRGEETNGQYQGRVVLLDENILNVISFGIDTQEGQSESLAPLQPALDAICTGLGQAAGCATVLNMSSSSNSTGSQNSFSVASTDLSLGVGPAGNVGLDSGVAQSSGNISESGTCQTATGSSSVANANLGVLALPAITADLLQGSSSSTACSNGNQSQSQSSTVINLMGVGVPLPGPGCDNGTPDSNGPLNNPLIATVCNADDANSGQTANPYGVREALTVFALAAVVKVAAAGPESHAVAPAATTPGPTANDDDGPGGGGTQGEQGGGAGDDGPGGPAASTAQGAGGELAFTGANLLVLALIGGALITGGVALARASTRHRRATA
jgi:hypothetical protein